jgi:hypothetical protein
MNKTAFVSGPIQGMEERQSYREVITKICASLGFDVIDPWLREKVIYNREDPCWWDNVPASGFVKRDLDDADRCDVMIVYLPRLSAGACMELFYAKRKNKKIIVISEMNCLSPWIVVHSDLIIKSFEDLESALTRVFE